MQTINQRFQSAIQDFMRSAEYGHAKPKIRARIFIEDAEPEISRLKLLEITEMAFRSREHKDVRDAEKADLDPQLKILGPGFAELFGSFRQRLRLKKGSKMMDLMTAAEFRQSAAVLRAAAKQRIDQKAELMERKAKQLERLAEKMAAHPRLTFREFRAGIEAGETAGVRARMEAVRV